MLILHLTSTSIKPAEIIFALLGINLRSFCLRVIRREIILPPTDMMLKIITAKQRASEARTTDG